VRRPAEVALWDRRRQVTWRQLEERANRLANWMSAKLAVRPGDRIAVLVHNRAEVAELLVATERASAIYVGLNFRSEPAELDLAFGNAEPAVVLAEPELMPQAERLAAAHRIPCIDIDGPEMDAGLSNASPVVPPVRALSAAETGAIVYTSGTTGAPKGVTFSRYAMIQHALVTMIEYGIDESSRYLVHIPHNSSVNITMLPCLLAGASLGFTDSRGFEPDRFLSDVAERSVTHTFLVPTQLMRLLDAMPGPDARLRSLSTLGYGSSPISPDRLGALVERVGPVLIQLYGMAEIASIGTLLRREDHRAALSDHPELLASAGQPSLAVDVAVVDDEGRQVETGERGEVVFTGPHLMSGYYRDRERTEAAMSDGWMHSGDIGHFDERGYLYIVDRKKNLIIRGGQNLAPTEMENILYAHPDVLEAVVVGAPDPEWGERIVAVVALRPGAQTQIDELHRHVQASSLAPFKRPEEIQIVESLPKNAVGKIDKAAVRGPWWSQGRRV
jgi:fatty-acyl-CoA synthase